MTKAKRGHQRKQEHQPGNVGAWIEWEVATKLCQLKLRTDSEWRVLLAVFLTSTRYGGRPAFLSITALAEMTGLGSRTVQAAVSRLMTSGLIVRDKRYRSLRCTLVPQKTGVTLGVESVVKDRSVSKSGSAGSSAPPKRSHDCASPKCIHVFVNSIEIGLSTFEAAFSSRQIQTIYRMLAQSQELLGADPLGLALSDQHAAILEQPVGATFSQALQHHCSNSSKRHARDLTKAILSLQRDERIQGVELLPDGAT